MRFSQCIKNSYVRYSKYAIVPVFLAAGIPTLLAAPAQPLRSPWDGKPVKSTDTPYACPAIAHLTPDLVTDGFYRLDDPTHSIIDPVRQEAYRKSSGKVKQVGMEIVKAADDYRTTGSREAAQCAMAQIIVLAQEHSLTGRMSSNQAYYVQGWVAGAIAIAYLKIRETGFATSKQEKVIAAWLQTIGDQTKNYYDSRANSKNNHLYWAGVELAAIGVVADNPNDFQWAIEAYDTGVDNIQPDGTLPLEMARGKRAVHYHLYALAPLVLIAEFG